MAERRLTRGQRSEAAAADAEAHRATPIDRELIRSAGHVKHHPVADDVLTAVLSYCGEHDLSTRGTLEVHYKVVYELAKEVDDDLPMAFRNLVLTLTGRRRLQSAISSINFELYEKVEGCVKSEVQDLDHPQLLELLGQVCAQFKKEEKLRNSSEYEKAFEVLEAAEELDLVVRAQWVARGELYKATGVLHSCVCLRGFNETFLGTSFDKTLHLPTGAQDLSFGDYTPHLAAKPGADSRLALSKIGDVPTRRPQLFSNLIIRVDGVVEAPPRRRRRATPSTRSFHAGAWPTRPDY